MQFYEVAPTKIFRANANLLTYSANTTYSVGALVLVPIGKTNTPAVVVRKVSKPTYETKEIIQLIEEMPLPSHIIQAALWMSTYYRTPLATVLQTVLPTGLLKKRRPIMAKAQTQIRDRTKIVFNKGQQAALEQIMQNNRGAVLLHGVTGSGKTELYKEIARRVTAAGSSAIVLVPEIALTSQIVQEFQHEFPNLIITHSQMTEAQRHTAWRNALLSTTPQVIIGPRSALFMPVSKLGAIMVDEAHEPSYKQEQAPRYSALRVASIMGKATSAKVVFGSATPLVADYYTAKSQGSPIVSLSRPAKKGTLAPTVSLIDMKQRTNFKQHRFLSDELLKSIAANLQNGTQTLLFHNRRGSASVTLCENCGWAAQCPRCFVPQVLHSDAYNLSCHICGQTNKVPSSCPVCSGASIIHKGIGTKLIESELRRLFPKANIARFDSDNLADETVHERYKELYDGTIDIAIGTQVVAKGLDLPKLQTVGVIQADTSLALPDYSSNERTFQLLAQVVGRVGRDDRSTNVVVQSYQPSHPVVQFGLSQNYSEFYDYIIAERRRANFPPFKFLLKLTNVYKSEAAAVRSARMLAQQLGGQLSADIEVLGPTPSFYERQGSTYRWQLVLKSSKREPLVTALDYLPPSHWQATLDPTSLL